MSNIPGNTRMRIVSPAKINLFLHVVGTRPDGYHDLETLFQFLDLHDIVEIEPAPNGVVERIDLHDFDLPELDLTVRAAHLLAAHAGMGDPPGVRITLRKRVPCAGGLGGGSSNAAAVLIGLNMLWDLGLKTTDLLELGARLGADVPIFIHGFSSWAEGIGNIFTPCAPPEMWCLVWIPDCGVSTKEVFEHPDLIRDHPPVTYRDFLEGRCGNSLEPVVRKLFKPVDEALSILGQYGKAQLNGSGSSVFLPCQDRNDANRIRKLLPADRTIHVTRTLNTFTRLISESD
ncbi:MAG: 4-(cytidine 5'-diphospho)-2-C-methyl-D-erythritol kinase [Gammaproteobacteria bacterium]|nr:4-(cytidine 5'-diphospho)-2-C-methyl-D-erythritol kinase [Gammaproteobacteria bacterium]MYJ51551.1 4-(cytidine 5'-diphospho)-2-C-methyl-D-erythritol kinase [Gammaproteobacteria bacterium]